jgi:hypothetical protein
VFYLSRDFHRLRARSYFVSAGKTAALPSGFCSHPALFVRHNTTCDQGLNQLSTPLRSSEALPGAALEQFPFIPSSPETCQFLPSWLRALSGSTSAEASVSATALFFRDCEVTRHPQLSIEIKSCLRAFRCLVYHFRTPAVSSLGGSSRLLWLPFPVAGSNRACSGLSSVFASEALPGVCRCSAGPLKSFGISARVSSRFLGRPRRCTPNL